LPQEYIIDEQEGVHEPIGMSGVRLEAKVHLVTCAANAAQNIKKCIRRCGLEVDEVVLEQLASSHAVLTEDEKQLGVALVDLGGGTTDIAIFTEGAIRHTGVIPIAGDQVTNDIAMALRTPTPHAEDLKLNMPVLWPSWRALRKPSRYPVLVTVRPVICPGSYWLRWSSPDMTNYLLWFRPSCGAVGLNSY
jgi:cell division protein FtsA